MTRIAVLTLISALTFTLGFAVDGSSELAAKGDKCDAYYYKVDPCDLNPANVPECDTMCFPAADCNAPGTVLCGENWALYKDEILNLHNTLRQRVASGEEKRGEPGPQPKGYDIYELKWDDELAKYAQRWVEQEKKGHDCGACRKPNGVTSTGQNCGYTGSPKASTFTMWGYVINGTKSFPGWYMEVDNYDGNNLAPGASKKTIGHYEQIIWGETKLIGCAVYSTDKPCTYINEKWGKYKCQMYACNYYPGRSSMKKAYSTDPADECATKSTLYPNLCV